MLIFTGIVKVLHKLFAQKIDLRDFILLRQGCLAIQSLSSAGTYLNLKIIIRIEHRPTIKGGWKLFFGDSLSISMNSINLLLIFPKKT